MNQYSYMTIVRWLGLPVIFFAAFFLVPLGVVLVSSFIDTSANSFTFDHYVRILFDQYHWGVISLTFKIALITTLVCLCIGYPLAWFLVRIVKSDLTRRVFIIILIVPLFTSNIVRSFGWMIMLGRNGQVNDLLRGLGLIDKPLRLIGTEAGILIGMIYILLPFMVLAIGTSLTRMDRALETASADLGAKPSTTFFHITLPLTLPGVASGSIMVFALAVSAYVTPALLSGGKLTVLSMLIYQQYSTVFDFQYGGALSIVLLVFTLTLVGLAHKAGQVRGA